MENFLKQKKDEKENAVNDEFAPKYREANDRFIKRLPSQLRELIEFTDNTIKHLQNGIDRVLAKEVLTLDLENRVYPEYIEELRQIQFGSYSKTTSLRSLVIQQFRDRQLAKEIDDISREERYKLLAVEKSFENILKNISIIRSNKKRYEYLTGELGFDIPAPPEKDLQSLEFLEVRKDLIK